MRLSLILEARDRASRVVERVRASVDRVRTRALAPLRRAMAAVDRLSGGFLGRLGPRLAAATASARRFAGRAGLGAIRLAAIGTGRAIGGMLRMAGGLASAGIQMASVGVGALGGWLTAGVIGQAAKFEQFQVVLENTEGSARKAKSAMNWVKQFAKTTPYEVGDVMEAFVALKAFGIDPMDGSLRSLGNASSGMAKPIMQAIEMLADANSGEFERLKEFGIKAAVQGEKVAFTYMKAGKEVTVTARKSAAEIQRAIIGIFDARFEGMMDRQSRTLVGMWSNLQDLIANFQLDVADTGIFDLIKGKMADLLTQVNKLAADGTLKRWAEAISSRLEAMVNHAWKFAEETDWEAVAVAIGNIAGAVIRVVEALGKAIDYAGRFAQWQEKIRLRGIVNDKGGVFGLGASSFRDRLGAGVQLEQIESGGKATKLNGKPRPLPWGRLPPQAAPYPLKGAAQRGAGPARTRPEKIAVDINLRGPGAALASVGRVRTDRGTLEAYVYRGRAMGAA